MSFLDADSFAKFMDDLAAVVEAARATGVPEGAIRKQAAALGDYLTRTIPPRTPEQALLKSLWDAGTEKEQQALANMLVKLVEQRPVPR